MGNRHYKNTLEFNENYAYDALDRLTTATRPGTTTPSWLWAYDKVGNRLVDQKADTSGVAASLSSYNATNQLTSRAAGGSIAVEGSTSEVASVSVNAQAAPTTGANTFQGKAVVSGSSPQQFTVQATDPSGNVRTSTYSVNVSSPGGATFTYDENGNTTQKVEGGDTWVYVWDAENRLVEVKKNGSTQATFRYDPMDRRVEKVAGGTTFRYVYDNEDWIRRTATPGGTQVDVVHGPGIDEPLAQDSGGVVTYYHADALGSVQKHTSAAGAVVQTIEYDAWGNALSGTPGAYGFTSREPDLETGLQYYRARYYDARAGRFVSEDPIGLSGWINFFAMAVNDPVGSTDAYGLSPGTRFSTLKEAVLDAFLFVFIGPYNKDREWGGRLCRDCGGERKFFWTGPVMGTASKYGIAQVNTHLAPCPGGSADVSQWHTHPGGGVGFSGGDQRGQDDPRTPPKVNFMMDGTGEVFERHPLGGNSYNGQDHILLHLNFQRR